MVKILRSGGPYSHAWLIQKCTKCDWTERSHGIELDACPKCGERVDDRRKLESGVTLIECNDHKENRFSVSEHHSMLTLYDPDIPDSIRFILRHYNDWTGSIESSDSLRLRLMDRLEWALEAVAYDWTNEVKDVLRDMKAMLSEYARTMPSELKGTVLNLVNSLYNKLTERETDKGAVVKDLWKIWKMLKRST